MNYEEMVKFAYEDIVDSFEKEAKKKKEEDREKIYDTPLGKRHVPYRKMERCRSI